MKLKGLLVIALMNIMIYSSAEASFSETQSESNCYDVESNIENTSAQSICISNANDVQTIDLIDKDGVVDSTFAIDSQSPQHKKKCHMECFTPGKKCIKPYKKVCK